MSSTPRASLPVRACTAAMALAVALGPAAPVHAAAQGTSAAVTSVEVFVNSAMVVALPPAPQGYQLTVHRMDQLENVTRALNQRIPRGDATVARRWFADNEARIKRELTPAATATANAINRANYYKLDRIPAVVVNRRTVVYGVTDVAVALQHYQASRTSRP